MHPKHVQLPVPFSQQIVERQPRLGPIRLHRAADRLDRGVEIVSGEPQLLLQEALAHALALGRVGAGDVAGVGLAQHQAVGLQQSPATAASSTPPFAYFFTSAT